MSDVAKGQSINRNLKARDWNDMLKMLREWRRSAATGAGMIPGVVQQRSVVWVKSVGAAHDPVDAGGIMQLYRSTTSAPPSDAYRTFKIGNPTPMLREPIIPVEVPSWSYEASSNVRMRRFVVLIDRLESGGVARAIFQGPTYAKIKLGNSDEQSFPYVQIVPDESGHLQQAPTGFGEILMREAGDPDDVVDALILVGCTPAGLLVRALESIPAGLGGGALSCGVLRSDTNVATSFKLLAYLLPNAPIDVGQEIGVIYRNNKLLNSPTNWIVAPYFYPSWRLVPE